MSLQVDDCIRANSPEELENQLSVLIQVGDLWAITTHDLRLGNFRCNIDTNALVLDIAISNVEGWPNMYVVTIHYWDMVQQLKHWMDYRRFMGKGHWRMCRA